MAGAAPIGAACADAHVGYSLCVGGVVGYRDFVSPSGVGYDIGCGNMAVLTDLRASDMKWMPGHSSDGRSAVAHIMDEIAERIDFGIGTRPGNEADHPVLERIEHADFVPQRGLRQLARDQLGTVGSGNHYVDLFVDEEDRVWVGVHFGSRGFGHKTATGFLAMAQEDARRRAYPSIQNFDESYSYLTRPHPPLESVFSGKADEGEMDAPPTLFAVNSELGQSYIAAMELAGAYAYAGREVVVQRVLDILGAKAVDTVHNHHNYQWEEEHWVDGKPEKLWVVRKGATPAFPGQRGFVGATMGEPAVILEGTHGSALRLTNEMEAVRNLQRDLLYSTVHGAGRVMSRTRAAGKSRDRWTCSNRDCEWRQQPHTHKPEDGNCPACGNGQLVKRAFQETAGEIDWDAVVDDLATKDIELRGANAEEAPGAYKRLDEVLAYQGDTIRVLHTLHPIGVAMASPSVRDPYKD